MNDPDQPRHQDASRISFPLQLMILAITTTVSVVGSVLGTTWTMRSDLRDIATRQALYQERSQEMNASQNERVRDIGGEVKMMRIDVETIKLTLAKAGILK